MDTATYTTGCTTTTSCTTTPPPLISNPISPKKSSWWSRYNTAVISLVMLLATLVSFTIVHESTHYAIYKDYGCENVRMGFDTDYSPLTSAVCNLTETRMNDLTRLQGEVELFQYPMFYLMMILTLFLTSSPRSPHP